MTLILKGLKKDLKDCVENANSEGLIIWGLWVALLATRSSFDTIL